MVDSFSTFDIVWILLLIIFLLPMVKQKILQLRRDSLIRRLEKIRNSRVITLIHRQEALSLLGIPFSKFIDIEDSEAILRAIRMTPKDKAIDLIIHTPGGLVLAATQIAMALKKHPGEVRVIVPHYAMSGGTLIALAADKIVMDENAVLGPVDPQLGIMMKSYPAVSVLKAIEAKGKENVDDETLIMGDIAKKAITQLNRFIVYLLKDKVGEKKAEEIARKLTEGRWTHDYPLTFHDLKEIGLNVDINVPNEIYMLMDLYPQPTKFSPSVEYVHEPYKVPKPKK
ncbi:MAG TPA: hypothetical protein ENG50_00665 [Candidatus Altiarchaeales archaeon]|nr:hypothetical protein [Candidatus Altiarchaeales archaeon]